MCKYNGEVVLKQTAVFVHGTHGCAS
jgi:hypothetical protein